MLNRNDRFTSTFKTRTGSKVKVEVDIRKSILVRTKEGSLLKVGDVISRRYQSFILTELENLRDIEEYKALKITHIVALSRKIETLDLVTGLPRGSAPLVIDPNLPLHVKNHGLISDQGFEAERLQVLSGTELLPGDTLGIWRVQTVQNLLGVYQAEVT